MGRESFVVVALLAVLAFASTAAAQQKAKKDGTQASVSTGSVLGIETVTLKDAVWSATTDPLKPNIITVALDLRQLSVLQEIYNLQLTVKLTNKRTKKIVETKTFQIPSLPGGKVYTQDFTTHLKPEDWSSIEAVPGKLEGTLQSHFYANQPEPAKPTV